MAPTSRRLVDSATDEVTARLPEEYAAPQVYVLTDPLSRRIDGAVVRYLTRDDVCERLEVIGRCPEAPGEVAVLEADLQGRELGDTVIGPRLGDLRIVGSYSTPTDTEDWLYPALLTSPPRTETSPYRPAPYVVAEQVVADLAPRLWSPQLQSRLEVPSTRSRRPAGRPGRRTELLRHRDDAVHRRRPDRHVAGQRAGGGARRRPRQGAAARSALAPAVVSLVLVALAMILRLQLAAAELRGSELALASLRGVGGRRAWLLGLAEPWLLAVVSVPLGVAGGYLGTRVLADSWLREDTALDLPTASVVGAVGVGVAVLAIAAAAVGRGLRETLGARLTGLHRPGSERAGRPGRGAGRRPPRCRAAAVRPRCRRRRPRCR